MAKNKLNVKIQFDNLQQNNLHDVANLSNRHQPILSTSVCKIRNMIIALEDNLQLKFEFSSSRNFARTQFSDDTLPIPELFSFRNTPQTSATTDLKMAFQQNHQNQRIPFYEIQ